jgi:hypothetical protein
MPMNDEDIQKLAQAIKQNMGPPPDGKVDPYVHRRHHDFIDSWMEKQSLKAKRWERARASLVGGLILSLIGGVGTFLAWVAHTIQGHWK